MRTRVLIIPDKFKGTLTARQAAEAIARGWRRARPRDDLDLLPMSDGGDGFGEVLRDLVGASVRRVRSVDAAHRACWAPWWWADRERTAIVESARVIGLAMLPPGRRRPLELDTRGLGAVLQAACGKGGGRVIVGVGGSATNDGGFGMARAMGWKFRGRDGREIGRWTGLTGLVAIEPPAVRGWDEGRITVAVDVQNPLLGPRGCSRVYGPQKGLHPEDLPLAEACLRRLASVVKRQRGVDLARVPGAGAAGGLGFGLMAFAGARVESGTELFARHARLDDRLSRADWVITGEGALDRSTLMGKGVGEVARRCRERGLPCVGLGGVVGDRLGAGRWFTEAHALVGLTSPGEARRRAGHWLARLAQGVAARLA